MVGLHQSRAVLPPPLGGRVPPKAAGGGALRHKLIGFARDMRWNPTNAEEKLWRILRNEKSALGKFRRQHPFGGKYILDFVSLDYKLVLEVDGEGHNFAKDTLRDKFITDQGFRIMHFSADDIMGNVPRIVALIADAVSNHPHPSHHTACGATPSPLKGEGEIRFRK